MTDEINKVLAEATRRPWSRWAWEKMLSDVAKKYGSEPIKADAELILIAVNSYEANQERIARLEEALLTYGGHDSKCKKTGFRCASPLGRDEQGRMGYCARSRAHKGDCAKDSDPCSCGFDAALSQPKPDTGGQP